MKPLHAIDPLVFDSELDYFPLYEGLKPSSMGLRKLPSFKTQPEEKNKTFLFGPSFQDFRKSKEMCRAEKLAKYYQATGEAFPEIISYIVSSLVDENPQHFSLSKQDEASVLYCQLTQEEIHFDSNWGLIGQKTNLSLPFVDAFDALAMQVAEDLVIHKVPRAQLSPFKSEKEKQDYAASIHLCHCNGWEAEWAINQSFDYVHKNVPRINEIVPHASRMMLSFLNQDWRFERIAAISFKTTPFICRHKSEQALWDQPFDSENPFLNIRVERQTVKGFPASEAFLFTIRTFLYDVNTSNSHLSKEIQVLRAKSIYETLSKPSPKSYAYKVINSLQAKVLPWLEELNQGDKLE